MRVQEYLVRPHPPATALELGKALLDSAAAIVFVTLLVAIVYAAKKYSVLRRNDLYYLLILFALLSFISTAMDAFDKWFWFSVEGF